MSFLDRLKREADQQRQQAEAVAREREEREVIYKTEIEPRMKALVTYLEGLAATLLEVKPPIAVTMPVQGYGDIVVRPLWDYKVEHERRHRSFVISMTWMQRIDAERSPTVRADNVTRVRALTNLFRQHQLGGIKEEKRSLQGELVVASFNARGHIKAQMQAQISTDDPVLRLMFENASWLGSSRRQVPWNQIDDGLFDRIARFVVREDDSLFTEEVPAELRQRLRKEPDAGAAPTAVDVQPPAAPAVPVASGPAVTKRVTPVVGPTAPVPPPTMAPDALTAAVNAGYKPGAAPTPSTMMQGEMIQIDESKLGLFGDPDAPVTGFVREGRAPATAAPSAPSAPAARPLMEGDVIPIDESKLGLPVTPRLMEGDVIEIDESKLGLFDLHESAEPVSSFVREVTPPASAALAPAPSPPAATVPPAASVVVRATPPAQAAPAGSAPPLTRPSAPPAAVAPARPPVASPAPPVPATAPAPMRPPVAPPAAAPSAAASAPARAPVVTPAPVPPAAAQSVAVAPPLAPAAPAARAVAPTTPDPAPPSPPVSDEDKEREAALFRLRLRATLARLKTEDGQKG